MHATRGDWRLEVLASDGRVEREVPLRDPEIVIGRTGRGLAFPGDAEMADRHARLRIASDGIEVSDSGEGSGVWLRVQGGEGHRLAANDQIWLGAQVLVVLHEGPTWQLRHHGADGRRREVYDLRVPGLFIGRGSELVLDPSDRGLSRRHAQIVFDGAGLTLHDRGAHNGTYRKLVRPEILQPGDEFRIAAQRFRIAAQRIGEAALSPPASAGGQGLAARLRALGDRERGIDARSPAGMSLAERRRGEGGPGVEPSVGDRAQPQAEARFPVVIDAGGQSFSFEVEAGQTLLEGVQAAGLERGTAIDWECLDGRCGVCVVGVVEGPENLDPPDLAAGEMRTIQITEQVVPDPNSYRLACLARVRGTVRLRRLT